MTSNQFLFDGPPLVSGAESLTSHRLRLGDLPHPQPSQLFSLLRDAHLRGRGGAGFPVATKWHVTAQHAHGNAIVVANALEGEPASAKDRTLIATRPHLVLDGAALAAAALRATHIVVAVRDDDQLGVDALQHAIEERRHAHLQERVEIATLPHAYIAGQETALIAALNGRRMLPTVVPPRPSERGVKKRPTLVNNVETFAHAALVARHGTRWLELWNAPLPGSALVTVSGSVTRPGVMEITHGTTVMDAITRAGATVPLQAVLIGGYGGQWINAEAAQTARLGIDISFGAGVIAAVPQHSCGVVELARVAAFLARERAAQCGPCTYGLPAVADAAQRIAKGEASPGIVNRLRGWLNDIRGRGACHHPDGTATFLETGFDTFASEVRNHMRPINCIRASQHVLPVPGVA